MLVMEKCDKKQRLSLCYKIQKLATDFFKYINILYLLYSININVVYDLKNRYSNAKHIRHSHISNDMGFSLLCFSLHGYLWIESPAYQITLEECGACMYQNMGWPMTFHQSVYN